VEIFYVNVDNCLRRTGFDSPDPSERQRNIETLPGHQGKERRKGRMPATRADLFGEGPDGQIFVTNKRDGIIRLLVP
jgi:hypothetical protein